MAQNIEAVGMEQTIIKKVIDAFTKRIIKRMPQGSFDDKTNKLTQRGKGLFADYMTQYFNKNKEDILNTMKTLQESGKSKKGQTAMLRELKKKIPGFRVSISGTEMSKPGRRSALRLTRGTQNQLVKYIYSTYKSGERLTDKGFDKIISKIRKGGVARKTMKQMQVESALKQRRRRGRTRSPVKPRERTMSIGKPRERTPIKTMPQRTMTTMSETIK